jgi:hypothetical protein
VLPEVGTDVGLPLPVAVAVGLPLPVAVAVGLPLPVEVAVGLPLPVEVGDADVGDTLGDDDSDGLAAEEPPGVGHIDTVVLGYGWADGTTPGPAPVGARAVVGAVVAPEPFCPELPVPDGAQPDVPLAPGTAPAAADDVLVPVAPRVPPGEVPVPVPFPVGCPEPSVPADPFEEFPPVSTVELT